MTYAGEAIQPGWAVWSSDGEKVGKVIATDPARISVKEDGLLGGKIDIPRAAIEEVETGRIELSMTKQELKSQS